MKRYYLILFILLPSLLINGSATSQCIKGDCDNGFGEKIYSDSSRFIGEFDSGLKKKGIYIYPDGDIYKGAFENNLRSGLATYSYKNGDEFDGIYLNDQRVYGKYISKNGNGYTGSFENNKFDGYGRLTLNTGQIWEGLWEDGKKLWGGYMKVQNDVVLVDSIIQTYEKSITGSYKKHSAPRLFAVVVGIADYEGTLSDLNYSDDDARLFYNHLMKSMPNEMAAGKSVLLLNKNATRRNIIDALQKVFSQSSENDFLIFYFSGHGSPGFFCPTDYTRQQIEHELVKSYFKNAKASYRVCIADACFSGSIGAGNNYLSVPSATQQLRDARLAVIMSSKSNQTSSETISLRQGVFSYYLIRGLMGKADLNKDSYITMAELFLYTKNAVSAKSNGEQIPVVYGKNLDKIPLTRVKQ